MNDRPIFYFLVMPDMERPPHRWDECCWRSLRHDLDNLLTWPKLSFLQWHWWGIKCLVKDAVTGKCHWHGLRDHTDDELRALGVPL